jgi:hypothetical protein
MRRRVLPYRARCLIVPLLRVTVQGKNRQGQQQQGQHGHRGGYGHHMPPMQPGMAHHGMPPGYPHAYGVEADPMGVLWWLFALYRFQRASRYSPMFCSNVFIV